jgi:methylenetetrahydrofolate reductase (NADPH)
MAAQLLDLGHSVIPHLAARMVEGPEHVQSIAAWLNAHGVRDLFVIGGDAPEQLGPFSSAGELLDLIAAHPQRPSALGIGAYPEGHPLIAQPVLDEALERKARVATYVVTQLCFDPGVLLTWLDGLRARGIDLPLHVGAAGPIERRKLLEISMRIGVGPSLRFARKQRGIAQLFRSPVDAATRVHDELAPLVGERIAGFHFFTFNELLATWRWHEERTAPARAHGR